MKAGIWCAVLLSWFCALSAGCTLEINEIGWGADTNQLWIKGTGFHPTPAENKVYLNHATVRSPVLAASVTELKVLPEFPEHEPPGELVHVSVCNGACTRGEFPLVTITHMSTYSGPEGAPVIIYGNNFDPVPTDNTVRFNGVVATVDPLSPAGQLDTTVPLGATTGHVTVETSAGKRSNSVAFVVTAPRAFLVGGEPVSMAVACLNGDEHPDLAAAHEGGVSVLLGLGNGLFGDPRTFGAGAGPTAVAAGDMDGDGVADLVVACSGEDPDHDGGVSILLGSGDGTFQDAAYHGAGKNTNDLALGDLDGDGDLDVVVTNEGEGAYPDYHAGTSVLLGNGDGTLQAAVHHDADTPPYALALGDLNGDAHPDLAVTYAIVYGGMLGGSYVAVQLGNGDGTFQPAQAYEAGYNPRYIALGDLDGDGDQDLVTGNAGPSPDSLSSISVLLGTGDGSFQAHQTMDAECSIRAVALGDLDAGGRPDLVTACSGTGAFGPYARCEAVSVHMGNGDGTFQEAETFTAGHGPMAMADLDADQDLDLVLTISDQSVSVVSGNGDGTFVTAPTYSAGGSGAFAFGDLDHDGHVDLATPGCPGTLLLGNGDGTFQTAANFPSDWICAAAVALGHLDADGHLDIAAAALRNDSFEPPPPPYDSYLLVLQGSGNGTLQYAGIHAAGVGPESVALGNLNDDENLDAVLSNSESDTVSVFLGNGDGTFANRTDHPVGAFPTRVAVGDLDLDGVDDVTVANRDSGTVSVLLALGDGTFSSIQEYSTGSEPASANLADFNGDGIPDIAVANHESASVSILLGEGDGAFRTAGSFPVGQGPTHAAVADFDLDGNQDLAVTDWPLNTVFLLLGNGDGTFLDPVGFGAGHTPFYVGTADLDGHGGPDLVVSNWRDGSVTVILVR